VKAVKVAMIAYEVYPFAKVGGLADVLGALPKAIEKSGAKVTIFMPLHKVVLKNSQKFGYQLSEIAQSIPVENVQTKETFDLYRSQLPSSSVTVYFIANDYYFSAENVYEGPDLAEQAIFFSAASIQAMRHLSEQFDVVHAHDWQTGLVPVYLKTLYRVDPFFSRTAIVFTIHNLGYQGIFSPNYMKFAGLPGYLFNIDGLEFYGKINFLKGGILFSDIVTTVSPTYAQEIQTEEYGEKLDGVLRLRSEDLYGILNGIDYEEFNPATDRRIYVNYDINNIEKKYEQEDVAERTEPPNERGCSVDRHDKQIGRSERVGPHRKDRRLFVPLRSAVRRARYGGEEVRRDVPTAPEKVPEQSFQQHEVRRRTCAEDLRRL